MTSKISSLSLLVFLLSSCGSEPAESPGFLTVRMLDSPAGEASGEAFLSTTSDALWMSWLEASPKGGHGLWVARLDGEAWSERRLVTSSHDFFVNWADFPSVVSDAGGNLWAHWLERGGQGTYDYGVRVVRSEDDGATWSEPWTPHTDGTPTEHGFVSMIPVGEGIGLSWLDGRRYVDGPDGPATKEMTIRFRMVSSAGPGPEQLVDPRVCDCCQTDAAMTTGGPVVVYRDRTDQEVRDIYIARMVDGSWTEGVPVHSDGWEIGGCPVNGPAVVAEGDDVAVAWFTGAGDQPRVKLAFSEDAGVTFGPPLVVDGGNPAGRVDLVRMVDGGVLVSWLERTGGDGAEVRARRGWPDGRLGPPLAVTASDAARGSGFPRLAALADGTVAVAWTDMQNGERPRVSVALVEERMP